MKQLKETPVWMWLIAGLIGLGLGIYADDISALIKSWQLGLHGTISN
jgi:hypothetical protein